MASLPMSNKRAWGTRMSVGKILTGLAAAFVAAEAVYSVADTSSHYLRPPGAQSEHDFLSRCIKCGKCAQACPHYAIRIAKDFDAQVSGTPYIDAETQPCRMCPSFPCVEVCPTEALRNIVTLRDVNMGYARISETRCIAYQGMRCEVCYRVCPLIDEAITIDFSALEDDNIHTRFIPVIDQEVCTDCGLCVQRCVVRDPRSAVRIVTLAEQEDI